MLARSAVVNGLLSLYRNPAYLEVGVFAGETFLAAEAARKVAVDVSFRLDVAAARREQAHAEFHEMPSDRWFGEVAGPRDRFDVIFLDGLHTFEQTLRDLLNAMPLLKRRGVIVLDDVLPNSELAGLPRWDEAHARHQAGEPWDGGWMGDVYRLVFFIESFLPGWSYRTTSDNHGQLVMWRGRRAPGPERRLEEIARLPYAALEAERGAFRWATAAEIRVEVMGDLRLRPPAPWTVGRVAAGVRRRLPGAGPRS